MDSTSQTLLIVVSVVLVIFLIVLIAAIIYLIKIMRQVRQITREAEKLAGTFGAAAEMFAKTATPLAILKTVSRIFGTTKRKRRKD